MATDLGVRRGARRRGLGLLQHEQRRAFPHDEAVAVGVEGARGVRGVVVWPRPERPDDVEGAERERAQGHFHAARQGRVGAAGTDEVERLAEGHGPGRARVGRREDGAVQAQGDAQVGRRCAAEHGKCQVRGDGRMPRSM